MLKDQYGNYVLQTMFNQAGLVQRKKLVARIKPYLELLNKHNFAKNIVFKIESEYSKWAIEQMCKLKQGMVQSLEKNTQEES